MITFNEIRQKFIATTAPKPNSVENFWQMVIENNVSKVNYICNKISFFENFNFSGEYYCDAHSFGGG